MNAIKSIIRQYKGVIKETPEYIEITAKNEIEAGKRVLCRVSVEKTSNYYLVRADEFTYSIIGGCSCGYNSLDKAIAEVKHELEKYCFKMNDYDLFNTLEA